MMLFKTKSRDVPSTPKIRSVTLPHDNSLDGYRSDGHIHRMYSRSMQLKSKVAAVDRQAATPVPTSGLHSSSWQGSSSSSFSATTGRTRTASMSSTVSKSPPKSILKKKEAADATNPLLSNPGPGPGAFVPKQKLVDETPSKEVYTSHNVTVVPVTVKAYTRKVPLKAESIALSWPLAERNLQKSQYYPRLYFDVGFDPRFDAVRFLERDGTRSRKVKLEEIAASTHCTLTTMTLSCGSVPGWTTEIRNEAGISCQDVFNAIYDSLQERLTRQELDGLYRLQPIVQEKFRRHFEQRCRESPGLTEYNIRQGPRKVDVLTGKRIFRGIVQNGNSWELLLDDNRRMSP